MKQKDTGYKGSPSLDGNTANNGENLEDCIRPIGNVDGRESEDGDHKEVEALESASERSYKLTKKPSETLVIHCADPRFGSAFQEFIKLELGIEHYTLLSVAGGAGPFTLYKFGSDRAEILADQLRLFIKEAGIKKVVVINHADCKWYARQMHNYGYQRVTDRQIIDLQLASRIIRFEIADVSVQTFLADLAGENVYFKVVPPG